MNTKFEVTLAGLREAGACYDGYNKVVRALQGRKFSDADRDRESYIRYRHDEPIPLTFILGSNDLDDALWALRCVPDVDRDARLFAVWCARQVEHLMTDQRSKTALDVAERFANGEATEKELAAARGAAWDAAWDAAYAAARPAARDAQSDIFIAMCEGRAPWQVNRYAAPVAAQAQPKRRPYNASGSLSEYGIFPECDAAPAAQAPRACTCHPDDRPDGPCRERYAASECQALAVLADREAQQQDQLDAARWRYIRRKLCLIGNGDGTCAMQAINLPAAIQGWPEPEQVAEFCDAAIDAALAQGQGGGDAPAT